MNIFKQLILSLYSPKAIASWRHQGIGKTILFVFFLTFISLLPTIIQMATALTNGIQVAQETINEEIPSFSIENGQLHAKDTSPITIHKQHFTIIFDPTGEVTLNDIDRSINSMALLKNHFVVTTGGTMENFPYEMLNEIVITKEDAISFIDSLDSLLAIIIPVFFIVIYLFTSGMKFIGVSLLALIGSLINTNSKESLKYRHVWRIAAYSVVLPTIFFTIMDLFKTVVPFGFLLNWFVSILVLILAIKEVPQDKPEL